MNKEQEQVYIQLLETFVSSHVDNVLKEPRSFIRYPFIDPGSMYEGNLWDWDSYWSVYGLLPFLKEKGDKRLDKVIVYAEGNIRNFFDHQLEDGYIPMMIEVADWLEPYLNLQHKNGKIMNMHKPFLCQQIMLISVYKNDYTWISGELDKLRLYFSCYDRYYFHPETGLYRWADDIMIGMDNDPASFGRPGFSTANIFLNAFMCMELQAMSKIAEGLGNREDENLYRKKREKLVLAINRQCWDERDKFFYSVDVDIKTRKYDWFHQGLGVFWQSLPIRIQAWSGFIPMYADIASKEQAAALAEHMQDTRSFWAPYGIRTLDRRERMYDLSETNNPSNWLGPIWLVANYVAFSALRKYGYNDCARQLYEHSLTLLGKDLKETGTLHEYYDPQTGRPIMNGGFMNWNILVLNMKRELEEDEQ